VGDEVARIQADIRAKVNARIAAKRKEVEALFEKKRAEVMKRVDFLNGGPDQIPGLIVMTITDNACAGSDLDPARDGIVVVFNADKLPKNVPVPGSAGAVLHPIQAASADAVVKTASVSGTDLSVPARTTAVFQIPQSGDRGGGPPCNNR